MDWTASLWILFVALGSMALGAAAAWRMRRNHPGLHPRPMAVLYSIALAVIGLIAVVLLVHFHPDWLRPGTGGFNLFWAVLLLAELGIIAVVLWQRAHAGAVLLDLGNPQRKVHATLAVLTLVAAVGLLSTGARHFTGQILYQLLLAAWFGLLARGGLELRERGLATPYGVVKWRRVLSRSWSRPDTLSLTLAHRLLGETGYDLKVPAGRESEVHAVLDRLIPEPPATAK